MTSPGPRRLVMRLPWASHFPRLVAPLAHALEGAARLGYAARGAVYLSIGAIALMAAAGLAPRAVGAVEALEAWGEWPVGIALLWITGLGLYAFAGWRALQAVFDADRLGKTPAALGSRAGKAISGLLYGGLAVSVFGLLDAMEDLHEADDQAKTQAAVQNALAMPWGDVLVMAAGAAILAVGAANVVRAFRDHFTESLDCDDEAAGWTGSLARIGYAGRGLAMVPAGLVMLSAGWHARASDARGLGGALDLLKDQPLGPALLAMIALGLIAFGAFGFLKAGLRRIGC
ncbi:MAG: DUF1206 domain-containing protein [Alphaproteobacteria bacterium]|nr:DUF1206 domain-containing protein [Alphaproteobacteria bacterium]MBU1516085.1 DUF1206 domain-containing protein [Alphaproteobacteria bacterium]MBU2092700.1 DUF1206 domain-containing protein [Alphaproteobacteria bacterium]MBU2153775.1 DUF1206 domain-containing protein [Alphaproteobacteria bacterium]MBU2308403.1 DUF1206 domain-containing protein [Alphaproteobacteria bacterium]